MRDDPTSRLCLLLLIALGLSLLTVPPAAAADEDPFVPLAREFDGPIRGVVKQFCLECHATDTQEGEFDLERFPDLPSVRKDPRAWQKVAEMLDNGEMPPKDSAQPSADERKQLRDWVSRYLDAEAHANAGDPGRVVLRRLSNAEYTYTLRDLTGIDLQPARDFPVDGAAGEGFTNTGESLVMSPALLTKYFDAGKRVAAHAVLLRDGFRFSPGESRRDWSNELVAQIRAIYGRYVDEEGRVPLESYLTALVTHRADLAAEKTSCAEVAAAQNLNARYLATLWQSLYDGEPSVLLDPLRQQFRMAEPQHVAALAFTIRAWQQSLFKFNNVGHFKPWMEPVDPLAEAVTLKLPLDATAGEFSLFLAAHDCGDGSTGESVVWRRPRFEAAGRPPLLLRDVQRVAAAMPSVLRHTLAHTSEYLTAAAAVQRAGPAAAIDQIAEAGGLDAEILRQWLAYLGVQDAAPVSIGEYLTSPDKNLGGYDFVNGWSAPGLPSLAANASEQTVMIPGDLPGRSVVVHPTPERFVAVVWKSPIEGEIGIEAEVGDAHAACGNGVRWSLEQHRRGTLERFGSGTVDNGATAAIAPVERQSVGIGDLVVLIVGARDRDHVCDLTHVELRITDRTDRGPAAAPRAWSLASDVAVDVLAGNPHSDQFGNAAVWHFYHGLDSGPPVAGAQIPAESLLSLWRSELLTPTTADKLAELAQQIEDLLGGERAQIAHAPDAALYEALHSWSGPLFGRVDLAKLISKLPGDVSSPASATADAVYGLDPARFGRGLDGAAAGPDDLVVAAGTTLELKLRSDLIGGREFIVEGALDPTAGPDSSVQLAAGTADPAGSVAAAPILTRPDTPGRARVMASYETFRQTFPATLCYRRIVPVDEVITLVLYHREDDALRRLVLSPGEIAELDALWDELRWVSQDALKIQESYVQFMEYVTQDNDPKLFEPLREPINQRGDEFQQQLREAEPRQLETLLAFAARAYRRPLTEADQAEIQTLYEALRRQELPHDEALRLVLARVLVSPSFLYRVERPAAGDQPGPVNEWELASRLSYFLWASTPDDELLKLAAAGQLRDPAVLGEQARRLLADDRVRGLAVEFACRWIDVQDFDTNDEKSEKHFPEFRGLRGDMHEEVVRFFADLFARDGSVLDVLDADHTFVNGPLAAHYGLPGVEGPEWRRVTGVKSHARGGILGMAAPLAMQSGASRTSPVLRGNWIVESLLGEKLPKPPKNVPLLPEDEAATDGLTVRQLVEQHRSVAECAVCHNRIDPFGFALESFDPIGRFREQDLGGRPIDTRVELADGNEFAGLEGVRQYLLHQRREAFLKTFCKKLLGYALGRGVALSDEPLLAEMRQALAQREYRFAAAVETIIHSPQFLEHRGRDVISPDDN